jgi:hypothetical protein
MISLIENPLPFYDSPVREWWVACAWEYEMERALMVFCKATSAIGMVWDFTDAEWEAASRKPFVKHRWLDNERVQVRKEAWEE